jgi:hypothetical protein
MENRNREGGNMQDIMIFNSIISNLGLQEIPLEGRKYTWSNMQQEPLHEQLDWCFTSFNWISDYPNTLMYPMAKVTSDHIPSVIQIGTSLPKAQILRFENFWMEHPDFMGIVKLTWEVDVRVNSIASRIAAKFKLLRRVLKCWSKGLAKFKQQLKQCNNILEILDKLEENGPLYNIEANFRAILKKHVLQILQNQKAYWKKRYTVRWTKLGDESTKFFHTAATERFRINTITSLNLEDGRVATSHLEKATLLWEEFRKQLGDSIQTEMHFNLGNLVEHHDLQQLDQQITHEEIDEIVKHLPSDKAPGPDGSNGAFLKKC